MFLGNWQAKPDADSLLDCSSLPSIEATKTPDQFDHGHCHKALSIEGAIDVFNRHAEDECGAHLRGETQVDEPDLPALR